MQCWLIWLRFSKKPTSEPGRQRARAHILKRRTSLQGRTQAAHKPQCRADGMPHVKDDRYKNNRKSDEI